MGRYSSEYDRGEEDRADREEMFQDVPFGLVEMFQSFKQKMFESVKQEIHLELANLRKENSVLKGFVEDFKDQEFQLIQQKQQLDFREKNLKSEVEKEFYASSIGDTLSKYVENSQLWYAESVNVVKKKCNKCDSNRQLIATYPDGTTTAKTCECGLPFTRYEPRISMLNSLVFSKKDSKYKTERSFYIKSIYKANTDSDYDYDNITFNLKHSVDKFTEDIKELYENKGYGEVIGFYTEEECQKFCDWLNKKYKC